MEVNDFEILLTDVTFQIMCLEGSVIPFISPSPGGSPDLV